MRIVDLDSAFRMYFPLRNDRSWPRASGSRCLLSEAMLPSLGRPDEGPWCIDLMAAFSA